MQIILDIDDATAHRLLAASGIDEEQLAAADSTPQEAVELVLSAAASVLAGDADAALEGMEIDGDKLKDELIRIASAARPIEVETDGRGQPRAVWTPDTRWQELDAAPDRYAELEDHIASIFELLAIEPALRTLISSRYLLTNEKIQEAVLGEIVEPVVVKVKMAGGTYRFRIAASGALLIGSPESQPERVRESR